MQNFAFEDGLDSLMGPDLSDLLAGSVPVGFEFAHCSYVLHTEEGLPWPASVGSSSFGLSVRAEKLPAGFGAEGTFRWHKNCVLPRLYVNVDGGDKSRLEGAAVQLSAVVVDVLKHEAHSVGLEGVSLRPVVNQACTFASLAFKTTSYNLAGRPSIHIMASLLRKLEKVGKEAARQHIDNSIDGLRAYLSALNIRNKCKHPLFLVLRFDACVGLLYDAATEPNPIDDDATFFRMMEVLAAAERAPPSQSTGAPPKFDSFVVAVKSTHDDSFCTQANCPVKLCTTLSLPHATSLPPTYVMLGDQQVKALRRAYCRLHCSHHNPGKCAFTPKPAVTTNSSMPAPVQLAPTNMSDVMQCGTCLVPHEQSVRPPVDPAHAAAQQHASALLASLQNMTIATAEDSSFLEHCPNQEWEHGMRVLAEAMSMHCRTRSADEILAYMQDEAASASKRPNNGGATSVHQTSVSQSAANFTAAGLGKPVVLPSFFSDEEYDHSHSMPTMFCDTECEDAFMDAMAHSHEHDHSAGLFGF